MIDIINIAPQSSIQDCGRAGYRHLGVTTSGPVDVYAHQLANLLLANTKDCATIELSLGPSALLFTQTTWIALTGADFHAHLDGSPVWSGWRTQVFAGQTLHLRGGQNGMRAYLAVDNGIQVPLVLGSSSTDLIAGFGGFEGRALRAGDKLSILPSSKALTIKGAYQQPWDNRVRVMKGPEYGAFTPEAQNSFWQQAWHVTHDSNRMGTRLSGEPLNLAHPLELPSHGVIPGVIQVPPSGQPIALLADAQTTGGYPKIAVICSADLWKLGQARAGQTLRVIHVDATQAKAARNQWQHYFNCLRSQIDKA